VAGFEHLDLPRIGFEPEQLHGAEGREGWVGVGHGWAPKGGVDD
jgi:hypothetical protein